MPTPAKRLELLEFMELDEVTGRIDLVEYLGYSKSGASSALHWLKRQRLIINDRRGEWVITDRGYERLDYLRDKRDKRDKREEVE